MSNSLINNDKRELQEVESIAGQHNMQADSPPVCDTIIGWLQKGAQGREDNAALHFGQSTISYGQLQKQSNRLACCLIDEGIKRGDRVGISLDRSIEMIACVIGILKAGAAYVPLDPHYPLKRLNIMKEDAGLRLLITHEKYLNTFEIEADNAVMWKAINERMAAYSGEAPMVSVRPEDPAYIIFTSGSTGRPKGVTMPHRALSNLIEWQLERKYFKEEAHVLQYSSISFDVSFQEIATTLASGGVLHLIEDQERRDPRVLLKRLDEWSIERLFIPFVALRSLIEVALTKTYLPGALKEIITAGEQLRVDAAVRKFFMQLPQHATLDNQYGPSETHVISAHLLGDEPSKWIDLPPIGKPVKNNSIYILDKNMQPVDDGESGELYLAGRNVANGYIGRDDLTKECFIDNPFEHPGRPVLYKTGDLGVYNEDGSIEFLGRADHQIKIRGYRVEPGEINSVGAKYPGVAQCLTHVLHDGAKKPQLVTYFITAKGIKVSKEGFKTHLSSSLPDYMVPAFVMEIKEIPYTPSGKVDKKGLPNPQPQLSSEETPEDTDYRTETEAELARMWEELLGMESIPHTANFFDLGGDSLLAVTLFLEIEKQFGKNLPLVTLAQDPTLKALAKRIDEKVEDIDVTQFRSLQPIQKGDGNEAPLSLVHGGGGNVLAFRELAKSLDSEIPVYGFQWPGWDGGRGDNDIVKMATFYVKELREACPEGPYRLGGNCIGGIIALEMAALLRAEGAEVLSPVLVADAPNLQSGSHHMKSPGASDKEFLAFRKARNTLATSISPKSPIWGEKEFSETEHIKAESSKKSIKQILLGSFKYTVKSLYRWIKYLRERRRRAMLRLKFRMLVQFSKPIPVQDRREYSALSQIYAIKHHKKKVYKEDVLYLRSSLVRANNLGLQGWWDDLFLGFGELCAGHFDAHVVGGPHNDILSNPYSQELIKEKMFSDKLNQHQE
jgi:amino acid adenylation domain-containing protein